jgi:hypothetical protein
MRACALRRPSLVSLSHLTAHRSIIRAKAARTVLGVSEVCTINLRASSSRMVLKDSARLHGSRSETEMMHPASPEAWTTTFSTANSFTNTMAHWRIA